MVLFTSLEKPVVYFFYLEQHLKEKDMTALDTTVENTFDLGPEVNLALGIERHDRDKIMRAIEAGARMVNHIYDPLLFGKTGSKEHYTSAMALALRCGLPGHIMQEMLEKDVR